MSTAAAPPPGLSQSMLDRYAELEPAAALAELEQAGLIGAATVRQLAASALAAVEAAPTAVGRWLALAAALNGLLGNQPELHGQISYAQARLYVQQGDLTLAETALRAAQFAWQTSNDRVALARSYLGLTQVLTLQGRYADAEAAARNAVAALESAVADGHADALLLAGAHRNLATLLSYQERHTAALQSYDHARQVLEDALRTATTSGSSVANLQAELAHTHINQAVSEMYLERTAAAETALHQAINLFDQLGDRVNRGRARSNLGALALRTGRYGIAVDEFETAARDLIGDEAPLATLDPAQLRNADILLLDQSMTYLALNLLPEAAEACSQSEALFRATGQPYELAQALLTQGLVSLRFGDHVGAEQVLVEARRLVQGLQNHYWQHRTDVALATLAYAQGQMIAAVALLDPLLAASAVATDEAAPLGWDLTSLAEAALLRARIHLSANEVAAAAERVELLRNRLGMAPVADESGAESPLHHLAVWFYHAQGLVAQATGDLAAARQAFYRAIDLVEQQRAALPIEEIRSTFLDDKAAIYSDLVLSLLADDDPAARAEAFAVVERARARVLLERMQTTLAANQPEDEPGQTRRQELQQQLHLLYNRLLGESGSRRTRPVLYDEIRACEAALRPLAWRSALPLPEATPVQLPDLQRALAPDQQAVAFFCAADEVMAFVVSQTDMHVVRRLSSPVALADAVSEWRFQIGRAELSSDYRARHAGHMAQAIERALALLYDLLVAKLAHLLTTPRLLFVPSGPLHQLPLHALWTGERYLLEAYECSYAPSASMAVRLLTAARGATAPTSWAGLALDDPAIPGARSEVEAAARYFSSHRLYVGETATLAGLEAAAQQADILHIATHGLFRPDNPFFSVLKLADSWVDVRTLYALPLAAKLVVLSACESGAGSVHGGDEVVGLARGFLAAGARSLLVSLWNVQDDSAVTLMDDFYQSLTEVGEARPAAALRRAQLAAVRAGKHPYEWAPFALIGC
jgi:CHAT domain-containing protein/tetratricopeptide (TPR) repeat protein